MAKKVERRLAAILSADVVGYSRLMGVDEEGTLSRLTAHRSELIDPQFAAHRGRIVKVMGDGVLVEFASVVDAVRCAVEFQRGMAKRNANEPEGRRIVFRIGINLGDIIVEGDDIYGDGVNVAARLQEIAAPGSVYISEDVHHHVEDKVETLFSDAGEHSVKNIARPLRVWRWAPDEKPEFVAAMTKPEPLQLPDEPSIAILPFENLSRDPEQEYLGDGIAEDIITALSKIPELFVIARTSTFAYKGTAVKIQEVGRELGVAYVLEGSVRKAGNRVRITAQLIDAADGHHLWAGRYDRELDDIFALQDEITLSIATELQVSLTEGEQARLRYTTTSNVEAWEHWVRGLSHARRASKDNSAQARIWLERALALDPDAAAIYATLARMYWEELRFGWTLEPDAWEARTEQLVGKALEIDADNPDALMVLALSKGFRGSHEEVAALLETSIARNPNHADSHASRAWVANFAGRPAEAIGPLRQAMRLSPRFPPWYEGVLGHSYRLLGRHDEAIASFKSYQAREPGTGHIDLVIIFSELERMDEAHAEAARLMEAHPRFTVSGWSNTQFYKDPARLEADMSALRQAGLPE